MPFTKLGTNAYTPFTDGSSLTGLVSANLTGNLPALNGSALTNISAGKIQQVVNATGGSEIMTSSTFNSCGLFVTITPSAATSSLFVIASTPRIYNNGTIGLIASIYKGTSGQGSGSAVQGCHSQGGGYSSNTHSPATMSVHIPASGVTTDATTFTVMHKNTNNSSLVGWYEGESGTDAEITVMEILA